MVVMSKIKAIIIFVFAACSVSVGLVLLYPLLQNSDISEVIIAEDPIPLGAEALSEAQISLLCEGRGTIEVLPYQKSYMQGQEVKFKAYPLDGWVFDHWTSDIPEKHSSSDFVTLRLPEGNFVATAVFVRE